MFELARQIARIAEATRRIDRTRCVSSLSKNIFRATQDASGLGSARQRFPIADRLRPCELAPVPNFLVWLV
jgi:hypothetical protein